MYHFKPSFDKPFICPILSGQIFLPDNCLDNVWSRQFSQYPTLSTVHRRARNCNHPKNHSHNVALTYIFPLQPGYGYLNGSFLNGAPNKCGQSGDSAWTYCLYARLSKINSNCSFPKNVVLPSDMKDPN